MPSVHDKRNTAQGSAWYHLDNATNLFNCFFLFCLCGWFHFPALPQFNVLLKHHSLRTAHCSEAVAESVKGVVSWFCRKTTQLKNSTRKYFLLSHEDVALVSADTGQEAVSNWQGRQTAAPAHNYHQSHWTKPESTHKFHWVLCFYKSARSTRVLAMEQSGTLSCRIDCNSLLYCNNIVIAILTGRSMLTVPIPYGNVGISPFVWSFQLILACWHVSVPIHEWKVKYLTFNCSVQCIESLRPHKRTNWNQIKITVQLVFSLRYMKHSVGAGPAMKEW